jgi:hypothetical protein
MTDFIDEGSPADPYAFIQWKGTDVCMDFHCECGAHNHFDGYFAYAVKCPHCGTIWEMPHYLKPRKAGEKTYPGHIEHAKDMEPDEDHCTEKVDHEGVTILVPHPVTG